MVTKHANIFLSFQVRENRHVAKSGDSNFEDGTIPFLSITSIRFGLEIVNSLGMERISRHTFQLARYFIQSLKLMKYENGNPVSQKYNFCMCVFYENL